MSTTKFISTKPAATSKHHALQMIRSAGVDRADQQPPIPGSAKNGFDDQRAADQAADVDAGDGPQGSAMTAFNACTNRMRDAFNPLAFGQCDVVLLQGRDHVGTKHAHDPRPFGDRERQRGAAPESANFSGRILSERT